MDGLQQKNRKDLTLTFVSTFVWGLIAHGYRFANIALSHDSLNEFYVFGDINYSEGSVFEWKVSLGRFVSPLYRLIFHGVTLSPWLIGILSLIWLSLSVFFVCKIFSVKREWVVISIAGILTVNLTVIATAATYIEELDANMFAVLLAVLATYFWNQGGKRILLMIPLIVVVLGIYQCMLSVAITLIVFKSILRLLDNDDCKDVIKEGITAIVVIIISGIIYLGMVKLACGFMSVELTSGYNGLTQLWSPKDIGIFELLINAYKDWGYAFIFEPTATFQSVSILLNALVLITGCVTVVYRFMKYKIKGSNTAVIILLGIFMPLAMNLSSIIINGGHHLTEFSFWLIYLLLLLLLTEPAAVKSGSSVAEKCLRDIGISAVILILISNVQTANAAYMKKDMEESTTLSTMTRVVDQLENTDGYEPGKTKVLFVGTPTSSNNDMYPSLKRLTGLDLTSSFKSPDFYKNYFRYVLAQPINVFSQYNYIDYNKTAELVKKNKMPSFPNDGYIEWLGDILVVRMS